MGIIIRGVVQATDPHDLNLIRLLFTIKNPKCIFLSYNDLVFIGTLIWNIIQKINLISNVGYKNNQCSGERITLAAKNTDIQSTNDVIQNMCLAETVTRKLINSTQ